MKFALVLLLIAAPVAAQDTVPVAVAQALATQRDDRPFQLALGALITSAAADTAVSEYAIGKYGAHEVFFGPTNHPVLFGVLKGACTAAAVWGASRLHRTHPKTAFWYAVVIASVEATLTARNARIGRTR